MTIRETAEQAVSDEVTNAERYSHEGNYYKLHVYRDGTVSWSESIDQHSDIIDDRAKGFAAIPSVARVGTGSCDCNCDYCYNVYDAGDEKEAIEEGRIYDKGNKFDSRQDAIEAAVSDADLSDRSQAMAEAFSGIPEGYFDDEK